MNKKNLACCVFVLLIVMAVTPFTFGKRTDLKNNDKFKAFTVSLTPGGIENLEVNYIPSEEDCVKVSGSHDELVAGYTITVDGIVYNLDVDFVYEGHVTWTLWNPVLPVAALPALTPCSKIHFDVKYMYNFLPASGIEGTIQMHAVGTSDSFVDMMINQEMMITSMQGTGNLQNVNIKAVGVPGPGHIGIVSGWPE